MANKLLSSVVNISRKPLSAALGRIAGRHLVLLACGLFIVMGSVAHAQIPLRSVAQLTVDDEGRQLNYPSIVFYDSQQDDIYLVNGGTSRVVIYGADFFPAASIGIGRGVEAPRGGEVLENGDVYLLQVRNVRSKRPRISVLSGAFFIKHEIFLDTIAEEPDFNPRSIAISKDGLIYVAGSTSRGAVVLDAQGNYLRHLRPLDNVAAQESAAPAEADAETEVEAETSGIVSLPDQAPATADIPEQFRPRPAGQGRSRPDPEAAVLNPVRINDVKIDRRGRIYLLSVETSKVYVYDAAERFLFSFGSKGGTPRNLSQPRALVIDDQRELIYIADYMRHTILAYNLEGRYLFEFGGRGVGPGWFNFPEDMTINNQGQLIVADLFNRRVQVLEVLYDEFSPSMKALVTPGMAAVAATEPLFSPPTSITLFGVEEETVADLTSGIEEQEVVEDLMSGIEEQEVVEDLAPGIDEQEAVEDFLQRWVSAWSAQDVDLYLSFYSAKFLPNGKISRGEWEDQRRERLSRPAFIEVDLDQFRTVHDDQDVVHIEVVQAYRSDIYADRTRKVFELHYEQDSWKIYREWPMESLGD